MLQRGILVCNDSPRYAGTWQAWDLSSGSKNENDAWTGPPNFSTKFFGFSVSLGLRWSTSSAYLLLGYLSLQISPVKVSNGQNSKSLSDSKRRKKSHLLFTVSCFDRAISVQREREPFKCAMPGKHIRILIASSTAAVKIVALHLFWLENRWMQNVCCACGHREVLWIF